MHEINARTVDLGKSVSVDADLGPPIWIGAPSWALQDKSDAAIDRQRNVAIEICAQGASSALAFQQDEGFGHGEIPAFVKDEAGFDTSVG
jgi:hypothetical protein